MNIPKETFWTVEELSREFHVNVRTIRSWIRTGALETLKIGNRHRIYESHWKRFV